MWFSFFIRIEYSFHFKPPKKQKPAVIEELNNIIQFKVVKNDPSLPPEEQTHNLIILAGLKSIFQKQLPKMPREYIARLVYDRNHLSMAIVKHGLQVRGGITWRPFESRAFSEIVFCAITGTEQVKVGFIFKIISTLSKTFTGIWFTFNESFKRSH